MAVTDSTPTRGTTVEYGGTELTLGMDYQCAYGKKRNTAQVMVHNIPHTNIQHMYLCLPYHKILAHIIACRYIIIGHAFIQNPC